MCPHKVSVLVLRPIMAGVLLLLNCIQEINNIIIYQYYAKYTAISLMCFVVMYTYNTAGRISKYQVALLKKI